MKKYLLHLYWLCLLGVPHAYAQYRPAPQAILEILARQSACWNEGDIRGFMQDYWQSDSLRFVGKNGITQGWAATLVRYQRSYPDRAAMGKLQFTILHTEQIERRHALVIGKWQLTRAHDEVLSGHFTLLWRRIRGKWVIVADHSS